MKECWYSYSYSYRFGIKTKYCKTSRVSMFRFVNTVEVEEDGGGSIRTTLRRFGGLTLKLSVVGGQADVANLTRGTSIGHTA